jgi:hypothetical protein
MSLGNDAAWDSTNYPVRQEVWDSYELLCDLDQGSDFDGDSAIYWQESYPVSKEILRQIVFQISVDGILWKDCTPVEGNETTAFFPGNNNVRAKAGCYLPPLAHHFHSEMRKLQIRALVPTALLKLSPEAVRRTSRSNETLVLDKEKKPVAHASMFGGDLRFENYWSGNAEELSVEIIYTVPPESFGAMNVYFSYPENLSVETFLKNINHDGNGKVLWDALKNNLIPGVERFTWLS